MPQCRNLMPVVLLDEWKQWLRDKGLEIIDTPIPYSQFGVRIDKDVYRVYERGSTHAGNNIVHASIYGPMINLAKEFLRERENNLKKDLL